MKKDIIINFVLTFSISIVLFIQNKYFIRYMGIEILGMMKLFSQLLQYLNIVELGLGGATTFALYKPLAEKNQEQVSIIISTIKSIYNKISIVLLGLGILITPFLPFFIKMENFSKYIYIYWNLYVINTVSTYLYIKYIILFTANQEFIYVRIVQSISKIFYQILQIFFIIKYHSFILFILLLLLDNLTQYIFFKYHYKKKYFYIYVTKKRYGRLKEDIKNIFWHKIGALVVYNTDLILISSLISLEKVGIYVNYQLVIQMISTIISTITNVMSPKIGKFVSINSEEAIYILFKQLNILFMGIAIFFSVVTYITINSFISLWVGEDLILGNSTIFLLCINIFIGIFRRILDIFKDSYGFFNDIQSPILESIINLLFSIILGIKYGLDGIIVGTIISNIVIVLMYKPILMFKRYFKKGRKEYIKVYGNYFSTIIISILCLKIVIRSFIRKDINNWLEWITYATTISVITGIVLLIVYLLNKDFRNILKQYILKVIGLE